MALRRQQAQEENEVRDLGLLYTGGGVHSVGQPVGESNGQLPGQSQFHTGIPSPPNDSDGGNRGGYGTVDGRLCFFFNVNLLYQSWLIKVIEEKVGKFV